MASLVALKMMKPSKSRQAGSGWHVQRSATDAVPADLRADGTSILREVVRRNVVKTVCRVGLWSLFTGLGAYWLFPACQRLWLVLLTGSAETGALSDTTLGYVGNILALMSVLFSILAGNSYTSLYGQNEAIFIELKAKRGVMNENQRRMRDQIIGAGFPWALCKSLDDVEAFLKPLVRLRLAS